MLITSLCGTREQQSRFPAHLSTPSPSAQVCRTLWSVKYQLYEPVQKCTKHEFISTMLVNFPVYSNIQVHLNAALHTVHFANSFGCCRH